MLKELGTALLNETDSFLYKPALIDLSTDAARYYTFHQIEEYSNYTASGFKLMGLPRGSKVAILGKNSFEYVVTYIGARRAELTPVLINYKLSNKQIQDIVIHSDSVLMMYDKELSNKVPLGFKKVCINNFEFEQFIIKKPQTFNSKIDDIPAVMLYTGGTTGTPKGVVITNEQRKWNIDNLINPNNKNFKVVLTTPLYHNNGLSNLERGLMEGATTLLMSTFDVEVFAKVINIHKVKFIAGVPTMFAMLFDKPSLIPPQGFKSVQKITLATAPTSPLLYRRIKEVFTNAEIVLKYGSTEAGAGVFSKHPTLPMPDMSVGYPKENYQYKLVNDVLHIKSPGTLSTYYKNPDETSKSLDEEGYYITKDKFEVDENGFYYFMGRSDDMFVCGGENIYPSEVQEILEQHPSVNQSIVVGVEDDIKGVKPCAFVKTINGFRDEVGLQEFFLKNAPAYMHPRKIWFVEEFPMTLLNKIDVTELKNRATIFLAQLAEQEGT